MTSGPFTIRFIGFRLQAPRLSRPSSTLMFNLILVAYFLISSGFVYDIIAEPPSMGTHQDPTTGHVKSIPFMPNRINGQYIIEGLSAGFLFTLGGFGIIMLDWANDKSISKRNRYLFTLSGVISFVASYSLCIVFFKIKVPGYLEGE